MISILIVDDHLMVREGLKKIIESDIDMQVKDQAQNAKEAIKVISKTPFDVVILDISLPDISGLDIIQTIKDKQSEIKIIVLSMYPEERFAIRALKAGASSYLTKEMAPENLLDAIRTVHTGRNYIPSSLADKLMNEVIDPVSRALHHKLSARETEVMFMIGSGKTTKEIADSLSLSSGTVSTYRSRILDKMGFKNNAAIMHYMIDNGLMY